MNYENILKMVEEEIDDQIRMDTEIMATCYQDYENKKDSYHAFRNQREAFMLVKDFIARAKVINK